MSNAGTTFDVIFRGDVIPGELMTEVKQRVAELFNVDSERADNLFSGRPVVLRKGVDEQTAKKYQLAMEKAGALVELKPVPEKADLPQDTAAETVCDVANDASNEVAETDAQEEGDLSLSPVGADVLAPEERRDFTPADIEVDHISVGAVGEDVLSANEKQPFVERDIDISHISLDNN